MLELGHQVRVGRFVGTVRFIGETKFAPGVWCGIELDEKTGKNDGSVNGIKYFETVKKDGFYGLFAKLESVQGSGSEVQNDQLPMGQNQSSNEKLQKLVVKLQDKLNEIHSRYEKLELELEACVMDKEAQTLEVEELSIELDTLKIEHQDLMAHTQELAEELELRRSIDLEEWKGDVTSEVLWKRNKLLEATLVKIQSCSDNFRTLNENLEQQNQNLGRENQSMKKSLQDANEELDGLRRLLENMDSQLESEVSYDHIVDKLTHENTNLHAQLEELQSERAVANDLEQIYRDLEEELSQQLHSLREKLESAQQKINALEVENSQLSSKLTLRDPSAERHLQELTSQIQHLHIQLHQKSLNIRYLSESWDESSTNLPLVVSRKLLFLSKLLKAGSFDSSQKTLQAYFLLQLASQSYTSAIRTARLTKLETSSFEIFTRDQIESWKDSIFKDKVPEELVELGVKPFLNSNNFMIDQDPLVLFRTLDEISSVLINTRHDLGDDLISALVRLGDLCHHRLTPGTEGSIMLFETNEVFVTAASFFEHVVCALECNGFEQSETVSFLRDFSDKLNQLKVTVATDARDDKSSELQVTNDEDATSAAKKLKLELEQMRETVLAKTANIEELNLKLKVFENKLQRQKMQEDIVSILQNDLSGLQLSRDELQSSVRNLEIANTNLKEALEVERIGRRFLFPNKELITLAKNTDDADHFALTSKINDLKAAILGMQHAHDGLDENFWLAKPVQSKDSFVNANFFNDLENTRSMFSEFLRDAEIAPVSFDSSTSSSLGFHCRWLDERNALLMEQLHNLAT
ncbi:LAFA_0B05050g1_1 [Lachancea sp. 'fantastica']|nr:LAFA_0B05050g1_1 [Lachancea sp. 'fantastica']